MPAQDVVAQSLKIKEGRLDNTQAPPLIYSLIYRVPQGSPPCSTGTSQPQFKKHFAASQW
jgi:hypothetical protein